MRSVIGAIIAILLVVFGIWVVFRIGRALITDSDTQTTSQTEELVVPTGGGEEEAQVDTKEGVSSSERAVLRERVETALSDKTYDVLSDTFTDNVVFRVMGSDCCGTISRDEAVAKLAFLEPSNTVWHVTGPDAKAVKNSDPAKYAEGLVFTSTDDMLAAFWLDPNGSIDEVELAADVDDLVKTR